MIRSYDCRTVGKNCALRLPSILMGAGLLLSAVFVSVHAEQVPAEGSVELIRDTWGIPHVFAETDVGAMYGLGYATAEDRGFQMYYTLRIMQGRLAELVGEVGKQGRRETAVDNDRQMRSFGFYSMAKRVAASLDSETRDLLRAYCAGVNDYFAGHRATRHPLFAKLGLDPEPWTPADCLVSWWHIAQFFESDGTRDLMASRTGAERLPARGGREKALRPPAPILGDDTTAVVGQGDASREWIQRVEEFQREHGVLGQEPKSGPAGPRFSHAWVIGGRKTSTGAAVLVSDPQTKVGNPSMFYEFHICGATFNARGMGVPGSPILLIGFSNKVAWGMTALGADQADLFRLKTDADHPDAYFFDGQWKPMETASETVRVKRGKSQEIKVRTTRFGPVITKYVFAQPEDGEFSVQRIPFWEVGRDTVQGAVAMMRAPNAREFGEALAGWRFPSANVVFGDREGNVGYWTAGAFPVRSRFAREAGQTPQDGSESKYDWQATLPHDLKPHLMNPTRGFVFSANHRPVASFYKIYLGHFTGSLGDTLRSWRLRELISDKDRFTPEEVLAVHYDSVNSARRDIVRIGYHLRDVLKMELSRDALAALKHLEGWYRAGCSMELTAPGAELAAKIDTLFRMMTTELALQHGGGESGLSRFLKSVHRRLDDNPQAAIEASEREFVDNALRNAWASARNEYGDDVTRWQQQAREAVRQRKLGYFESLDGFPSLDQSLDLNTPDLKCVDGATIRSQGAQAYTQFVSLHDVDQARSLLPIGSSDNPASPSYRSTLSLWERAELHPAPLSRSAVLALMQSRTMLAGETSK